MKTKTSRLVGRLGLIVVMTSFIPGCLHLDLHIKLLTDGTATATERVRFSEQLLDMGAASGGKLDVAPLLTKASALERMKRMGPGVSLISHTVKDIEGGAKESVAVFKVQNLHGFKYVSPFLCYTDFPENHVVQCHYVPLYKSRNYNGRAGEMAIAFRTLKRAKAEPRIDPKAPPKKGPSPAQLQAFREVEPVFRDMLKDFRLRLRFESYSAIRSTGFGFRGYKSRVSHVDVINFTDKDLDRWGGRFLENEEIMLDLIRWDMGSANIASTVYLFANNPSVPIFLPFGSRHQRWIQSDEIYIPPSKPIFDKYFAGKELDFSHWGPSPKVKAAFQRIGWKDDPAYVAPK